MEQHPVPRNISSFEFHLVGDMTLRQFGYVAGGGILAFLIYKIAPFPAIIKYPLVGITALIGLAFAFLPIQERPLDRWLVAFIKSVYAPSQYLWKKTNPTPEILARISFVTTISTPQQQIASKNEAEEKLRAYLATVPAAPHQTLNLREQSYINKTLSYFNTTYIAAPVEQTPKQPTPVTAQPVNVVQVQPITPITVPEKPENKEPLPLPEILEAAIQTQPVTPVTAPVTNEYLSLKKQLDELAAEKEKLAKELTMLKTAQEKINQPEVVKLQQAQEVKKPTIQTVTPQIAVNEVGLTNISQVPNLVMGVVKDSQKRFLPNIILTVKDTKGIPIRAIKTNKLGQFATATSLPNGTYLLEVEDPLKRYVFDIAEITLSGKVFQPIVIFAKGEKELIREKLSKELFGNVNM
ncbi:PrgI family protein [Candidatus Microgenomates bacterium]|nr:PrgI family protein [Candidatus Microgenomates bacterium]